jgi:eukaryotic-like serine/threonine-protein kinase
MADERDAGDDSTRLTGFGTNDETRFAGVAAAPKTVGPATAAPRSDSSIAPGALLGHTYRIESMLARGGMGEVYRARHAELETDHAIKIILPELANDQRIVDLFRREAAVLRTIRHDAVVAYDGVFRDENSRLYLVMEFADGPSLSKLMRERTFSADEIRQLRDRLADGLAVAHEKGVIHRDISPDNVILPGGQVTQAKIIDFGISKLADPETKTIIGSDFAGKYSYVSPEQLGMFGGQVDGRSDIYSLGLVLVAAAQGEPLDMGQSPISVIEARRSVPDLSRVSEDVRADLAAMLQPDPADRPQSMRAVVSSGSQQGRRAADTDRRADRRSTDRRPADSKRFGVAAIAGALAIVVAAGAAAYWYLPGSGDDTGGEGTETQTTASTTPSTEGNSTTTTAAGTSTVPNQTAQNQGPSQSDSGVADTSGDGEEAGDAGSSSSPDISTQTSGDTGATTAATVDAGQAAVVPDNGEQPTDTQVGATFPVPDIAKLREDAQRLVQNLSCSGVQVDVSDRGDITASGYVGSEADRTSTAEQLRKLPDVGQIDNALVVMKRPLCDALGVVREETAYGAATAPRIDPGGVGGVYRAGENLKLTVTAMADGYLYIDYIDVENEPDYIPVQPGETDRYVLHLLPNDRWRKTETLVKAGEAVVIGTLPDELANYVIRPPFGTYLIVAISSPERLFERPRTIEEPAETYLPALRAQLAAVARRVGRENLPATTATIVFQEK